MNVLKLTDDIILYCIVLFRYYTFTFLLYYSICQNSRTYRSLVPIILVVTI